MILKGNVMTCKYNSILICIIPMSIVRGSCSLRNKTYNLIVNYLCGNATTYIYIYIYIYIILLYSTDTYILLVVHQHLPRSSMAFEHGPNEYYPLRCSLIIEFLFYDCITPLYHAHFIHSARYEDCD